MPSSFKKILDMDYFFLVSPTLSLQIERSKPPHYLNGGTGVPTKIELFLYPFLSPCLSTHKRSRMHEWAEERDDAVQAHWFLYRSSRLVKEAVALLLFL